MVLVMTVTLGIGGVAAIYFVVRAAVRAGNSDSKRDQ